MPIVFTCAYCGAELATVDDVVAIKELKQLLDRVPEACPNCGATLHGKIQYDKIVVEVGRVRPVSERVRRGKRKKEIESVI
jgi:transcription elongation factor Elf1